MRRRRTPDAVHGRRCPRPVGSSSCLLARVVPARQTTPARSASHQTFTIRDPTSPTLLRVLAGHRVLNRAHVLGAVPGRHHAQQARSQHVCCSDPTTAVAARRRPTQYECPSCADSARPAPGSRFREVRIPGGQDRTLRAAFIGLSDLSRQEVRADLQRGSGAGDPDVLWQECSAPTVPDGRRC